MDYCLLTAVFPNRVCMTGDDWTSYKGERVGDEDSPSKCFPSTLWESGYNNGNYNNIGKHIVP